MTTESFNQFTNRVEQAPPTTQSQIARLVFEAKQGGRRAAVARMALRSIPGGTEALIASTQPSPPPAPPRVSAPPPAPPAPIPVAAPPAPPAAPPSDPSLFDKTLGRGIGAVGRGVLGVGRFVQPAAMPVLENLGKAIETGVGTGVSTFGAVTPGDFMGLEKNLAEERARRGIQTSLPTFMQASPLLGLENLIRGNLPQELQAQAAAWRATDMPSTTWNALPGQGIPLPGGKRLDEIDIGVKGAFELLPELGLGIATGGGSAAGGLARRTATSAANVLGADIAMLGAKGALGAGRAATRGAKAVIPSGSAAKQADVAARGALPTHADVLDSFSGPSEFKQFVIRGETTKPGLYEAGGAVYRLTENGDVTRLQDVVSSYSFKTKKFSFERINQEPVPSEIAPLLEGTKVVDSTGKPLRVFHGTASDFDEFIPFKPKDIGGQTKGIYFEPTKKDAEPWTRQGGVGRSRTGEPRIIEAYVNLKNPVETRSANAPMTSNREELIEQGYDGKISRDSDGEITEVVAFDNSQIHQVSTPARQADVAADVEPKQLKFDFVDDPDISPVTGKPTVVDEAFEANQTKAVELPEGYSPGLIEDLVPKIVSPNVVRRAVEKSKKLLKAVKIKNDQLEPSTLPGMAVSAVIKAAAPRISSTSNRLIQDVRGQLTKRDASGNRVFEFSNDDMRVENIQGISGEINPRTGKLLEPSPTVADIAQDYGAYEKFLTPDQRAVMESLRVRAEGLTADLEQFGFTVGYKAELGDGGFFISRGPTQRIVDKAGEVVEAPPTEKRIITKESFEKERTRHPVTDEPLTQVEMIQGVPDPKNPKKFLVAPQKYLPVWDEFGQWSTGIYDSILDRQIGKFLLGYVDPVSGEAIAFKGSALAVEAHALRAKISAAIKSLDKQKVQLTERQKAYVEASKNLNNSVYDLNNASAKLEELQSVKAIQDEVKKVYTKAENALAKAKRILDNKKSNSDVRKMNADDLQDQVDSLVKFEEAQKKFLANAEARLNDKRFAKARNSVISAAKREVLDGNRFVSRAARLRERSESMLVTARNREANALAKEAVAEVEVNLAKKDFLDTEIPKIAEKALGRAEGEFKQLRKQVTARNRELDRAGTKLRSADARYFESYKKLGELKSQLEKLRKKIGKEKIVESQGRTRVRDTGYRTIDNQVMLDDLDLQTIRRTTQDMKPLSGRGSSILRTLGTYQSIRRAIGATLDDSGVSIQGKLEQFARPKEFAGAYKAHLQSLIGKPGRKGKRLQRESMADNLRDFDAKSQKDGAPSSHEIIDRMGIRFGGVDTEVTLRPQGITESIGKLPLIRRANEAFGAFGDMLRLKSARKEIMEYMRLSGKTFDELVADGTARKIGNGVNGLTGWTPNGVAGVFGDMLLFAPRFFRARIETLHRATKGMDVDFMVDALPFDRQIRQNLNINYGIRNSIDADQLIARRAVMKMVSMGTLITVAANEVLGQETDFQLMRNGRMNPNFMSVRLTKLGAPRDWNIFGPYKSMAALMLASGGAGWEKEPQKALDAWLNLSSPVVGDLFEFMNFRAYGESRFGETLPEYIAESHIPFALQEVPNIIKETSIGNPKDAFGGGLSIGLELIGEQSSPLSRSDILQDHVGGLFRSGMVSADNYEDLEPYEKNDVKDSLVAELEKFEIESAATGKPLRRFFATVDIINRRRDSQLQEAMFFFYAGQRSDGGEYTKRDFIDDYFDIIDDARERKEQVEETLNIEWKDKVIADDDLEAQALEAWNEAPSKSLTPAGSYLPEKMKRLRDKVLKDYPQQADYIIRNTNDTPLPQGFLEALERAGLKSTVDRIKKSDAARQARGAPARAVVPSEALIPPEQPSGIQQTVGQPVVEDTPETVLRTRELLAP